MPFTLNNIFKKYTGAILEIGFSLLKPGDFLICSHLTRPCLKPTNSNNIFFLLCLYKYLYINLVGR